MSNNIYICKTSFLNHLTAQGGKKDFRKLNVFCGKEITFPFISLQNEISLETFLSSRHWECRLSKFSWLRAMWRWDRLKMTLWIPKSKKLHFLPPGRSRVQYSAVRELHYGSTLGLSDDSKSFSPSCMPPQPTSSSPVQHQTRAKEQGWLFCVVGLFIYFFGAGD